MRREKLRREKDYAIRGDKSRCNREVGTRASVDRIYQEQYRGEASRELLRSYEGAYARDSRYRYGRSMQPDDSYRRAEYSKKAYYYRY